MPWQSGFYEGQSGSLVITTQTGNYAFQASDANTEVDYNSGSAGTFTIEPYSSAPMAIGTIIQCRQRGTGQLTIAAATGVTLYYANAAVTRAQYSLISITQGALNIWYVDGDT